MALYGLPSLPLGVAGSGQTSLTAEGAIASGLEIGARFHRPRTCRRASTATLQLADGAAGRKGRGAHRGGRSGAMADDHRPELPRHGHGHAGVADGRASTSPTGCWWSPTSQGEIADGPVSGDVNAEIKDGVPHLTGDLALDAFDAAAGRRHGGRRCQPAAGAAAAGRPCRSSRRSRCRSPPNST